MEISDTQLKQKIEHLIQKEATIDSTKIEIKAELGFINLNGSVTSEEQKTAVEALVKSQSDVKGVFNYLVVRPIGIVGSPGF